VSADEVDAGTGHDLVGSTLELEVGPVAHGGHCVARHEGRVVFVRHALPGERVRAVVTEGGADARYLRADAVDVLQAAPERVESRCPVSGPGGCGGCDFQHVSLPGQRQLLGAVVREQLQRLAGIDQEVEVEAVPGDDEGLGWRTRVRFASAADGSPGLRKHRSHEVVSVDRCPIAVPDLPDVTPALRAGSESAEAVRTSTGERVVVTEPRSAPVVTEHAAGRRWQVGAGDFWQVHPGAPDALVDAVLNGVDPQPGELAWDLYAGVGLFSAGLAERVGPAGKVVSVESHRRASAHARTNLADLGNVRCVTDSAERYVRSRAAQGRLDVVVLDPPRTGAGRKVVEAISKRGPRVVAYVACDPAALGRDLGTFGQFGYGLKSLRSLQLFPMTHHVECVAICSRRTP
jgi:tRNA/tmRNA/rRNA uracil-C5-methylase (TrmA/RlmC/RlmD family)